MTAQRETSTPRRDEQCPLRPGDGCRMCVPGATGPSDCGLVYLVSSDPGLLAGLLAVTPPR